MSVVSIFGDDAEAEARALQKVTAGRRQPTAQAMGEASALLQAILEAGDLVGRDTAGWMVIQLAVEPRDFDRLMAFGADAVEAEDGGDEEPYQCSPMSACWFWDGGATFFGRPTDQVFDLVPPKQIGRVARIAQAVALACCSRPCLRSTPAPTRCPSWPRSRCPRHRRRSSAVASAARGSPVAMAASAPRSSARRIRAAPVRPRAGRSLRGKSLAGPAVSIPLETVHVVSLATTG